MSADDWKIVAFAVETGLRRGEQFHLRWDHVDLENGILTMPLPKGGRTRHVPLSELAKELIRSLDSFLNSPWVFPGLRKVGKPMDSRAFLRRAFEPALKRAGIQGACWHTLRHTAASRRIMDGVDLVSVKELLGHRDIQTTYRYSHLSPEHLKDAINRGSLKVNRDQNRDQGTKNEAGELQVVDSVVRPTGLEPVTPRSVVWCSIH
jgi:integrase